jgi:excisionase family DNA binding protein
MERTQRDGQLDGDVQTNERESGVADGRRPERLLTVNEAAECVGCCEETIRRAYLAGQLDVLRFGARRVRVRRSALFAWLERGGKTTAA